LLKKAYKFNWEDKCEEGFDDIKVVVSSTPVLEKSKTGSRLLLYLFVSMDAFSSTLVQEGEYKSVYFTGRTLQDVETKYQVIKKATLALGYTTRHRRPYFQGHPLIVKTDYPNGKGLPKT